MNNRVTLNLGIRTEVEDVCRRPSRQNPGIHFSSPTRSPRGSGRVGSPRVTAPGKAYRELGHVPRPHETVAVAHSL